MLSTVTRTCVGHQHAHSFFRHAEGLGKLPANAEGTLRAGPNGQVIALPFRQRSAGFQGNVGDVRNRISLLEFVIRGSQSLVDVANSETVAVTRGIVSVLRVLLQVLEKFVMRWLAFRLPFGMERLEGSFREGRTRCGDSDEVAVVDHGDTHLLRFLRVQ